jgi:O-antigen/teichoic acid export membrane protein
MIASVIVTRALGPVNKGVYAYVFVLIMTVLDLLKLNMDVSSVYHIGKNKYKVEEFISIYILLTIVLGGLAVGAYFIFAEPIRIYVLKDINPSYLNIAVFSIPVFLMQYYLANILWGLNDLNKYNISRILQPVFLLSFALVVLLFTRNVYYFIIANIGSFLFSIFVYSYFLRNYIKKISLRINIDYGYLLPGSESHGILFGCVGCRVFVAYSFCNKCSLFSRVEFHKKCRSGSSY